MKGDDDDFAGEGEAEGNEGTKTSGDIHGARAFIYHSFIVLITQGCRGPTKERYLTTMGMTGQGQLGITRWQDLLTPGSRVMLEKEDEW